MLGTFLSFSAMRRRTGASTGSLHLKLWLLRSTKQSISFFSFGSKWRQSCCWFLMRSRTSGLLSHVVARPSNEIWWQPSSTSSESRGEFSGEAPEDEATDDARLVTTMTPSTQDLISHSCGLRPASLEDLRDRKLRRASIDIHIYSLKSDGNYITKISWYSWCIIAKNAFIPIYIVNQKTWNFSTLGKKETVTKFCGTICGATCCNQASNTVCGHCQVHQSIAAGSGDRSSCLLWHHAIWVPLYGTPMYALTSRIGFCFSLHLRNLKISNWNNRLKKEPGARAWKKIGMHPMVR